MKVVTIKELQHAANVGVCYTRLVPTFRFRQPKLSIDDMDLGSIISTAVKGTKMKMY